MFFALCCFVMDAKRKRLFYSANDDLILLREIQGQNPYEDLTRWNVIARNVREASCKDFTKRSMQDRARILLEKFQKKVAEDPFKSGVEEEVDELDDLLHMILLLIKEFKKKEKPIKSLHQIGIERRDIAVEQIAKDIFGGDEGTCSNNIILEIEDRDEVSNNEEQIIVIPEDLESRNLNPLEKDNTDIDLYRLPDVTPLNVPYQEGRGKILGKTGHKRAAGQNTINNREVNKEFENIDPVQAASQVERGKTSGARGRGRGCQSGVLSRGRHSLKFSSIRFLEKKNDRWYEIRTRELDLEEQKFLLEKKDREKNMEMFEKKQEAELKIITNQQKLMENQQKLLEMAFSVVRQF